MNKILRISFDISFEPDALSGLHFERAVDIFNFCMLFGHWVFWEYETIFMFKKFEFDEEKKRTFLNIFVFFSNVLTMILLNFREGSFESSLSKWFLFFVYLINSHKSCMLLVTIAMFFRNFMFFVLTMIFFLLYVFKKFLHFSKFFRFIHVFFVAFAFFIAFWHFLLQYDLKFSEKETQRTETSMNFWIKFVNAFTKLSISFAELRFRRCDDEISKKIFNIFFTFNFFHNFFLRTDVFFVFSNNLIIIDMWSNDSFNFSVVSQRIK